MGLLPTGTRLERTFCVAFHDCMLRRVCSCPCIAALGVPLCAQFEQPHHGSFTGVSLQARRTARAHRSAHSKCFPQKCSHLKSALSLSADVSTSFRPRKPNSFGFRVEMRKCTLFVPHETDSISLDIPQHVGTCADGYSTTFGRPREGASLSPRTSHASLYAVGAAHC